MGRRLPSVCCVVALGLSACPSDVEDAIAPEPDPEAVVFASGSRLKARFYEADGVRAFLDFMDTELGVPCSFHRTSQGWRCVPAWVEDLGFSGSTCAGDVVAEWHEEDACGEPPRFGAVVTRAPCTLGGDGARVEELFALGPPSAEKVVLRRRDSCEPALAFAMPASPVALDSLVGAHEDVAPIADGLGVNMLIADDGAQLSLGLYDTEQSTRCIRFSDSDDAVPCVPSNSAIDDGLTFGDPECSVRVAARDAGCEYLPDFAFRIEGSCSNRMVGIVEVGAPTAEVFDGRAGCGVIEQLNFRGFEVGQSVPDSAFPATVTAQRGTGRLVVREVATASGAATTVGAGDAGFFDTTMGKSCVPMPTADGPVRCVSGTDIPDAAELFADPDCTVRAVPIAGCNGEEPADVPQYAYSLTGCAHDVVSQAFELGGIVHTVYDAVSAGRCYPSGGGESYRVVVGEVNLDVFEEVLLKTD